MSYLPILLLISAATCIGAAVISVLIAQRSRREARSTIFPVVREAETARARWATVSTVFFTCLTLFCLSGWVLNFVVPFSRLEVSLAGPAQIASNVAAILANPAEPEYRAVETQTETPVTEPDRDDAPPPESPAPVPSPTSAEPTPTNRPTVLFSPAILPTATADPLYRPTAVTPSPTSTNTTAPTALTPPPATPTPPAPPVARLSTEQLSAALAEVELADLPTITTTQATTAISIVMTDTTLTTETVALLLTPVASLEEKPVDDQLRAFEFSTQQRLIEPRPVAATTSGEGAIESLIFVTSLEADASNSQQTFSDDIARVYARYQASQVQQGTTLTVRWYLDGTEVWQDETTWQWGADANSYTFISNMGNGQYRVELYFDDRLVSSGEFVIQ